VVAANAAVANLMQELKMQLIQLPKKVSRTSIKGRQSMLMMSSSTQEEFCCHAILSDCTICPLHGVQVRNMSYKEYMASHSFTATATAAAEAAVNSKLEQMELQSSAAATAGRTTRSLRSRTRAATTGEPQTVRATRARQPVPKFNVNSSSTVAAVAPAVCMAGGDDQPQQLAGTVADDQSPTGQAQVITFAAPGVSAEPATAASSSSHQAIRLNQCTLQAIGEKKPQQQQQQQMVLLLL